MKSLQERMEGIFIGLVKQTILPRLQEVIKEWGQEGLDKAVLRDEDIFELMRRKDPLKYQFFDGLNNKLKPLRKFMYKWDNTWNTRFLIRLLKRDGIYFTPTAEQWLKKQLDEMKELVYGNTDPRNKKWLYDRYIRKIIPDDLEEYLRKV